MTTKSPSASTRLIVTLLFGFLLDVGREERLEAIDAIGRRRVVLLVLGAEVLGRGFDVMFVQHRVVGRDDDFLVGFLFVGI